MSVPMLAANTIDRKFNPNWLSEQVLTSRAISGDPDAFVELSKRHANRVYQATYRVTRNRQDAEDAVQIAFLNAFTHMKHFEGRSSFSTWITRIGINSALMILRKKRNSCEVSIDGADNLLGNLTTWEPPSPIEDPESQYAQEERSKLLRKAILRLPPVYREIIELRQGKERSLAEIAHSLGITVSAVKARLTRAKSVLRTAMLKTDSYSASYASSRREKAGS